MARTMTYFDVVQEILKRVNDSEGDIYLDRAKSLVYEGITSLAIAEGVTENDIFGLIKSETRIVGEFSNASQLQIKGDGRDLDSNPSKIVSIVDDLTDSGSNFKYIEISIEERNRLNDIDYRPFDDEIFYYLRGNYIYFYPKERMTSQKFVITYIAEPDEYVYSDNISESTFFEKLFSLNFIYKVIDYSTSRIKQQQSGE